MYLMKSAIALSVAQLLMGLRATQFLKSEFGLDLNTLLYTSNV